MLKLNDQELPVLAAMFGLRGGVREQLAALAEQFGLRAVALTRGAGGSLLHVAASLGDAEPKVAASLRDAESSEKSPVRRSAPLKLSGMTAEMFLIWERRSPDRRDHY